MESYKEQFAELKEKLRAKGVDAFGLFSTFYPAVQHIRLDMLQEKDWPYHIAENSIYLRFSIDFDNRSVELDRYGHIGLTDHDRKVSYLCMCSMKKAHKAIGGRWFRRTTFKGIDDLVDKMERFYVLVHKTVEQVTDGYPYKQMKINIY